MCVCVCINKLDEINQRISEIIASFWEVFVRHTINWLKLPLRSFIVHILVCRTQNSENCDYSLLKFLNVLNFPCFDLCSVRYVYCLVCKRPVCWLVCRLSNVLPFVVSKWFVFSPSVRMLPCANLIVCVPSVSFVVSEPIVPVLSLVPPVHRSVCLPSFQCAVRVPSVCVLPVPFVVCKPTVTLLSADLRFLRCLCANCAYDCTVIYAVCHVCCMCAISLLFIVYEPIIYVQTNPCYVLCTVRSVRCHLITINLPVLYMMIMHVLSVCRMFCKLCVPTDTFTNSLVCCPSRVSSVRGQFSVFSVCVQTVPVMILVLFWTSHVLSCEPPVQCLVVSCALLPLCCLVGCHSHRLFVGRPSHVLSVSKISVHCLC